MFSESFFSSSIAEPVANRGFEFDNAVLPAYLKLHFNFYHTSFCQLLLLRLPYQLASLTPTLIHSLYYLSKCFVDLAREVLQF